MIIRCERCTTLYELDDALLSPEGTPVQCARCQHVFTARPPAAGSTPGEARPQQPVAASPPAAAPPAPPRVEPSPPAPQGSPSGAQAARRPAVYRPPISQPGIVARPPLMRRDTVGTFESRLRWSHRWKWLAPVLLVGVLGLVGAAFLFREAAAEAAAQKAQDRALALALADDVQSLERARAALGEILAASPRRHAAGADRALVELLLGGVLAEAPGDRGGAAAQRQRSQELVTTAEAALEALRKANLARPEVSRALAVAAALRPGRSELRRLSDAAEGALPGDPFVITAAASADLRSTDRAVRDRALADLALLVSRRPEALRARYVLARGQVLAGRHAEALSTLAGILQANPRHEGALALREQLAHSTPGASIGASIAPPATATASGGAGEAARAGKPGAAPRKPDSTEGEPDGTPRTEAAPRRPAAVASPASDQAGSPASEPPAAGGTDASPAPEPPLAPRLRPAAVPDPEPVREGG